jgi:hypothetical protein
MVCIICGRESGCIHESLVAEYSERRRASFESDLDDSPSQMILGNFSGLILRIDTSGHNSLGVHLNQDLYELGKRSKDFLGKEVHYRDLEGGNE